MKPIVDEHVFRQKFFEFFSNLDESVPNPPKHPKRKCGPGED